MRQKICIFTKTISCSSSVLPKSYGPLIWLPEGALRHLKASIASDWPHHQNLLSVSTRRLRASSH